MISKLIDGIRAKKAPVVVGLDPNLKFIPAELMDEEKREVAGRESVYDEDLETAAEAVWHFNHDIIDAVADLVPAVKPQSAMYEQFGIPGIVTFWKTIRYANEKGLIVIGDVKRGDIGSTSEAYAAAHLGKIGIGGTKTKVFDEDFATVNPYLGSDGVKPFIDVCNENDRGIFVLVKTSNPSSGELQDLKMADGRAVYEVVGEYVNEWGKLSMDGEYSNIGAVVGATYPEQGKVLRKLMPHTFILVPGYGAQGAKGSDLTDFFDDRGLGAIVNSSRGIIAAYLKEKYQGFGPEGFAEAARAAAEDMIKDIGTALEKAGKSIR